MNTLQDLKGFETKNTVTPPVEDQLSLLRFITCGSVDDGKSTLIGRMLFDAGQVFEDQIDALDNASAKYGTLGSERDFALLVDGLAAEREQGITIDVAYRYFRTKKRAFIVADTPGHEQYTRNMATGASTAQVAIILIDARKGVLAQTRRHALIVSMLGVKKIVLAINKMDLVEYSKSVFETITDDFMSLSHAFNFNEIVAIPVCAKNGENVFDHSQNMPWYSGQSLLEYLENVETGRQASDRFYFPVQWVNRPNLDFRGFSGYVSSGEVSVGQNIRVSSSGQTSKIMRIVTYDGDLNSAIAGQAITLTLEDEIDISRGDILSLANDNTRPSLEFEAQVLWMSSSLMRIDREYYIKHAGNETTARITKLIDTTNFDTLKSEEAKFLKMNGIAKVQIIASTPLLVSNYANDHELGAFILIDRQTNETVAIGLVSGPTQPQTAKPQSNFKNLLKTLIGNSEAVDKIISYGLKWYPISGLLTFTIAALVTGNLVIAIIFAGLELLLKPIAQIGHMRILAKIASKKNVQVEEINIDGSGI
jgi:sulfate adenylyltransferase large subunit